MDAKEKEDAKMFEDFELDYKVMGVAGIFWLLIVAGLWKFQVGTGWGTWQKIMLTILTLPLCYFIVNWQLNR